MPFLQLCDLSHAARKANKGLEYGTGSGATKAELCAGAAHCLVCGCQLCLIGLLGTAAAGSLQQEAAVATALPY